MARKIPHGNAEGWTYPIDPKTVLHNTLTGTGYTVNLQTGKVPTTGTMVSIPGHEQTVSTSSITSMTFPILLHLKNTRMY